VICVDAVATVCDEAGDVAETETCGVEELCQEGDGCLSCAVSVEAGLGPDATEAALVRLDPAPVEAGDWALRRLSMRPVQVAVDPLLRTGSVTVERAGEGVAAWSEEGEALSLPLVVDATALPLTVLVQGLEDGATATLTASTEGCGAAPMSVELRVAPWTALAGQALVGFPWFEKVRAFTGRQSPQVALDPALHGDLAGRKATAWVVAHRSPVEWAADPVLVDDGDGAETVAIGGETLVANTWTVWATDVAVRPGVLSDSYDVVLDLDGDGSLSPGDLFQGPGEAEPAFYLLSDLSRAGPHKALSTLYSGGLWLGEEAYYPSDIADLVAAQGPRPLVVISHGNGHDYRWYDYLGDHLASWGFVVMTHQNDTGPGIETASETTLSNTDYFLTHLAEVDGGVLDGMIDGHRIAWIGHSRGGEGVARAYDRLVTGDYVPEAYTADDIVLISSIAPTVFLGTGQSNPHDRWYHLIAGTADGDVTGGPDSGIVQYLRIAEVAQEDMAVTLVHGAAHNDFNCCGFSDGVGPDRIGRDEAQIVARAVYLALLEWVVEGDPAPADLLRRQFGSFHNAGTPADVVVANQYRPGPARGRLVLDDFQDGPELEVASTGEAVSATVEDLAEGRLDDADSSFAWTGTDPMNGMTLAEDSDEDTRGAVFDWSVGSDEAWRVAVPADAQDLRAWTWLSLRACQGSRHPDTVLLDGPLDFAVTLIDALGQESTIRMDDAGLSLTEPYQRTSYGPGAGWANEWSTVRLRLADFQAEGTALDLSHVVAVELRFGEAWGAPEGRIGLDDLMLLSDEVTP